MPEVSEILRPSLGKKATDALKVTGSNTGSLST